MITHVSRVHDAVTPWSPRDRILSRCPPRLVADCSCVLLRPSRVGSSVGSFECADALDDDVTGPFHVPTRRPACLPWLKMECARHTLLRAPALVTLALLCARHLELFTKGLSPCEVLSHGKKQLRCFMPSALEVSQAALWRVTGTPPGSSESHSWTPESHEVLCASCQAPLGSYRLGQDHPHHSLCLRAVLDFWQLDPCSGKLPTAVSQQRKCEGHVRRKFHRHCQSKMDYHSRVPETGGVVPHLMPSQSLSLSENPSAGVPP